VFWSADGYINPPIFTLRLIRSSADRWRWREELHFMKKRNQGCVMSMVSAARAKCLREVNTRGCVAREVEAAVEATAKAKAKVTAKAKAKVTAKAKAKVTAKATATAKAKAKVTATTTAQTTRNVGVQRVSSVLGVLGVVGVVGLVGAGLLSGCDGGGDECAAGSKGCRCYGNGTCDPDGQGGYLVCSAGVCVAPQCEVGSEGCGCYPNLTCNSGLACSADPLGPVCVDSACPPGQYGCACRADNTCSDGGLRCLAGVCTTADCAPGAKGCPCIQAQTCPPPFECVGYRCENTGEAVLPPENPKCYTPCQADLVRADNTVIPCSYEGLMEGCFGGRICVNGSCISQQKDSTEGGGCAVEADCPDFQTCIGGACYSNCEQDADCTAGRTCYRKVCRMTCLVDEADGCPHGEHCLNVDGDGGVCMTDTAPEGAVDEVEGSFSLSTDALEFSNVSTQASVYLTNESNQTREFTVKKIRHTYYDDQGFHTDRDTPLHWLQIGEWGSAVQADTVSLLVDGGAEKRLVFLDAHNPTFSRWRGLVEISNPQLGAKRIQLAYAEVPEGQWRGSVYYFASFGDENLAEWMAIKDGNVDPATYQQTLSGVGNAFVQKWGAFRMGWISYDEMMAALESAAVESWDWPSTREICPWPNGACYPYDNPAGYVEYSSDVDVVPVPGGMMKLPFAVNLRPDPAAADPTVFSGKIVSSESLHYAGDPAVSVTYKADPADPNACSANAYGACVMHVTGFSAASYLGGRYRREASSDGCPASMSAVRYPWLVDGFWAATEEQEGQRYFFECRSETAPFGASASSSDDMSTVNVNLAGGNPIPDGRTLQREITLVDGALVDGEELVILFKERFDSFLSPQDTAGFTGYGVLVLSRAPATLDDEDYGGWEVISAPPPVDDPLELACAPYLIEEILGQDGGLDGTTADDMARGLLHGEAATADPPEPIDSDDPAERVHYLCVETGHFDNGPIDENDPVSQTPCPVTSEVIYFTADPNGVTSPPDFCQESGFESHSCNTDPDDSCRDRLEQWADEGVCSIRLNPMWRCTDANEQYCSTDRYELRAGKTFYKESAGEPVFVPLRPTIDEAFRYKTRFRNREGLNIGFAPTICAKDTNTVPYCYDPVDIEQVRDRVNCALHLFTAYHAADGSGPGLSEESKDDLAQYLTFNFAVDEDTGREGFERLYAELLIMMGDEAFTEASASRFDLAGAAIHAFEGSLFEVDGIDLSGVAGYELYALYKAAQYYQMALDRFYSLSPYIWEAVGYGPGARRNFVTQQTVTTYMERLTRATTQRARAFSEIAKRYQGFNRPDLARRVIGRAYGSVYMESLVLSRMMQKVVEVSDPQARAQIRKAIGDSQRAMDAALTDMRDVHSNLGQAVNAFGFAPDYMPFPALEPSESNAFDKIMQIASQRLAVARSKEETALSMSRAFDTDEAAFQAELVQIANNYENALAEICGTFQGDDGLIYPAITKYAHLNENAEQFGNPCGLAGNGRIHDLMLQLEIDRTDLDIAINNYESLVEEIDIELARHNAACEELQNFADIKINKQKEIDTVQGKIDDFQEGIYHAEKTLAIANKMADLKSCMVIVGVATGSDCPAKALATVLWSITAAAAYGTITALRAVILNKKDDIRELKRDMISIETDHQCAMDGINSEARIQTLVLDLEPNQLETVKAHLRVLKTLAAIEAQRNKAKRLETQMVEAEAMAINVQAAKNDPNRRIFKNDAVIMAERTFDLAMAAAYRATKVYEYYTSMTYPDQDQLYLIRMIAHGDYNLESYLYELEEAFYQFEETHGKPDKRIQVLSLRDDILDIPRLSEDYRALSEEERVALFREKLTDPAMLDGNGYFIAPFNTNLTRLSPLTHNHKISHIEAEFVGSDVGDSEGRVYLRQRGTGVVRGLDGETTYYTFPERAAVLNTFFNGERRWIYSDDEVLRNYRLRDRPLVNTRWELLINWNDEWVNKDINPLSLTDVRLYFYYTDFTQM
jgi:hypothetical protein